MPAVTISNLTIGRAEGPLALIAGPCVVESLELCRHVAAEVLAITRSLGMFYIFKASFDKANRTAVTSFRGRGMEDGLAVLAAIKQEFGVPVLTDVHETWQCRPVAEVCDVLQIPAFLCRQTDLLLAAAETGRALNIKKGQFLAPWDMRNVVEKVESTGNRNLLLTERGVSFGYNTLVVDMTSLPQMRALGYPVVFDGTHSVQKPGGGAGGTSSGGQREFIPHLTRAAVATGVDALFLEVHPGPEKGLSDAASMLPLSDLPGLLRQAVAIDAILRESGKKGADESR
ncbi:MAG TPA: 3-deoxy-8-phosphooctulonate synthase [Chthonomonadaceae bacterium]|nr:3-deoxy-8-phosphooctulonate synthase [Chthonomonadaceae bacterium]